MEMDLLGLRVESDIVNIGRKRPDVFRRYLRLAWYHDAHKKAFYTGGGRFLIGVCVRLCQLAPYDGVRDVFSNALCS